MLLSDEVVGVNTRECANKWLFDSVEVLVRIVIVHRELWGTRRKIQKKRMPSPLLCAIKPQVCDVRISLTITAMGCGDGVFEWVSVARNTLGLISNFKLGKIIVIIIIIIDNAICNSTSELVTQQVHKTNSYQWQHIHIIKSYRLSGVSVVVWCVHAARTKESDILCKCCHVILTTQIDLWGDHNTLVALCSLGCS